MPVWIGAALSLVLTVLYFISRGTGDGTIDTMSWWVFGSLCAQTVTVSALLLLKKTDWARLALGVLSLVSLVLYIGKIYWYVSAAAQGIDVFWTPVFFLAAALFVLILTLGIIGIFQIRQIGSTLQKAAAVTLAVLFALVSVGTTIAFDNTNAINGFLNVKTSETVGSDAADGAMYYPSAYTALKDLIAHDYDVCERAEAEGAVLLYNNGALPITGSKNVSLFGVTAADPVYGGTGSGGIDTSSAPTFKESLERDGQFAVNDTLWDWYRAEEQSGYKRVAGKTVTSSGIRAINDAPWDAVYAANNASFASFGDAAIVVFGRVGGEGTDLPRGEYAVNILDDSDGSKGDTFGGDYLKLSPTELSILAGLKEQKDNGVFDRIIVLLNTANQIEADFIDNEAYGIDACLWIGTTGQTGLYAIADILSGKVNPSGSLPDTFWRTHDQNPAMPNFGAKQYAGADEYYTVYQEGIYVGYRYTETRYEDYVMETENTGDYDYQKTVSYPFGYGLSYTEFAYSDFAVEKSGEGADTVYTVSVTVTNTGDLAGKEPVQVYLQKPYGEYNRAHHVEAAAAELVGFAKTDLLQPGESQTVLIPVQERQFAAYDAYNEKTYVIVDGDYYLTVATDAHNAVNNLLEKKGYGGSARMTGSGDASLVSDAITLPFDAVTYSTSEATGEPITNRFDTVDLTLYAGDGTDTVEYVTRSNWEGTVELDWSKHVQLIWTAELEANANSLGRTGETKVAKDSGAYPAYGVFPKNEDGSERVVKLIELRADENGELIAYDDPLWDTLLDQLTWEEQVDLVRSGMRFTGAISTIDKMQTVDHNGPSGLTEPYTLGKSGLATKTKDPDRGIKPTCYPASGILAATMNIDLLFEIGDCIGEDALWAGYNGLYGPGSNIHRTPYAGRNFEYYSEDGYLSGMICAYECAAMECHGLYVYNKHCALNDQEDGRNGIFTWANEQAIREIYLRAFELPITVEGKSYAWNGEAIKLKGASGVMLGLNRMGCFWTGMTNGLINGFLRGECGMHGIAITDMWFGSSYTYQNMPAMLLAGTNLIDGQQDAAQMDACKTDHADVAWALRDSTHRILYTVVHSNAMNGITEDVTVKILTPWWQKALIGLEIGFGILFAVSLAWITLSELSKRKKQRSA